jgi:hypothetical protein
VNRLGTFEAELLRGFVDSFVGKGYIRLDVTDR